MNIQISACKTWLLLPNGGMERVADVLALRVYFYPGKEHVVVQTKSGSVAVPCASAAEAETAAHQIRALLLFVSSGDGL